MREVVRWACEMCGQEYDDQGDALRCEASGFPEPVPFLKVGPVLPLFGESGVVTAAIGEIFLTARSGNHHEWRIHPNPTVSVSHNLDSWGGVPADAFDPRRGVDAFRYGCDRDDLEIWESTMRAYGFTESEATDWVRDRVCEARARLRGGVP